MKRLSFLSAFFACFCFIIAFLLLSVRVMAFNTDFYNKQYAKLGSAQAIKMSEADLTAATQALLDYTQGRRDDIVVYADVNGVNRAVFDERETMHMVDVRKLYENAMATMYVLFGAAIVLGAAAYFINKRFFSYTLSRAYIVTVVSLGAAVFLLGVYMATDFNAFWTKFHLTFFTNDLWLLDPAVSIMINMFPESLFFGLIIKILSLFTAIILTIATAAYFVQKPYKAAAKRKKIHS